MEPKQNRVGGIEQGRRFWYGASLRRETLFRLCALIGINY